MFRAGWCANESPEWEILLAVVIVLYSRRLLRLQVPLKAVLLKPQSWSRLKPAYKHTITAVSGKMLLEIIGGLKFELLGLCEFNLI